MSPLTVLPVAPDEPLFDAFLILPWRIYPGRHGWVPPVRAAVAAELSPANHFFRHGQAQAFLALREGEPVGRVVASVDDALADPEVGHFGYFEVLEDAAAAEALLAAAADWVAARGRRVLHGPVDLSIYHRYRLQTAGFARRPFFGEPRSPGYYADMLDASGLEPVARWYSWDVPGRHFTAFRDAMAARGTAMPDGFSISPFDLADFDAECARLHPLVASTFQHNYGYSAIDADEFAQRFGDARHFMSATASHKVTGPDGQLVAYSYAYADPGPDFAEADGDHAKLGFSEAGRERLFVAHTFGIAEPYRRSGLAELLFWHGLNGMADGFDHGIGALAKEGPAAYARFGEPSRAYAVFGRSLA